jgi:HD-GYP domain-containing protein (c-di-GMP phosphodiesterase class II)
MAKPGRKSKDECFIDGFNPMKKGAPGIRELQKKIKDIAAVAAAKKKASEEKAEKNSKKNLENDDELDPVLEGKEAYKMMKDMRSVYKSAGGKTKLLGLIKGDDKLLIAMIKELMKYETSLMATEIRNKENNVGGNTATFVILKGLQTAEDVMVVKEEGPIDMKQVRDAINPSAEKKIEYEEEMERPA